MPHDSPHRPRFAVGAHVTVLDLPADGHVRTPRYVRRHRGVVAQHCGDFPNPEARALGQSGLPAMALYRVDFVLAELFPTGATEPDDVVSVEIFEHWLACTGTA